MLDSQTIAAHLGEESVKEVVNWTLQYLSTIDIPVKRGTFIEFRTGMLNISPIGRNCSREERNAFEEYDKEHQIRSTMVTAMRRTIEEKLDSVEATKAYHADLQKLGLSPFRELNADLELTEEVLKAGLE